MTIFSRWRHGRDGRLWRGLRERADGAPALARGARRASRTARARRPDAAFEFFADILGRRRGRERLIARLGHEAADPIDEFLALALTYERQQRADAAGISWHWFDAGAAEIKRDMEQGRNEVRVMTVHGAKGLEANIVIPARHVQRAGRPHRSPAALDDSDVPLPLWPIRAANDDAQCSAARQASRLVRAREYRRLLYVAATRARDRLYVAGWQRERRAPGCWYDLIAPAIEGHAESSDVMLPWEEKGRRLARPQAGPGDADPSPHAARRYGCGDAAMVRGPGARRADAAAPADAVAARGGTRGALAARRR